MQFCILSSRFLCFIQPCMITEVVEIATRDIPEVAIADAIPPVANTTDNVSPSNFHFLKRFAACLKAQHFL